MNSLQLPSYPPPGNNWKVKKKPNKSLNLRAPIYLRKFAESKNRGVSKRLRVSWQKNSQRTSGFEAFEKNIQKKLQATNRPFRVGSLNYFLIKKSQFRVRAGSTAFN
jgi:hypothetical protein